MAITLHSPDCFIVTAIKYRYFLHYKCRNRNKRRGTHGEGSEEYGRGIILIIVFIDIAWKMNTGNE